MADFPSVPLGDLVLSQDGRRRPIRASERERGPFPYYGASGVIDSVGDYIFDGLHLLIAEDGENLRTRKTAVAFLADGKFWVNNHAHVVVANDKADTRYLCYAVESSDISGFLTGSTQPKLTQAALLKLPVIAPPLVEQRAIAEVLGALDDKYESNQRRVAIAQDLIHTEFLASTVNGARDGSFGEVLSELRSKVSGDTAGVVVLSALAGGRLAASDDYFTKKVYSAAIDKYLRVPQWAFAYNPSRINIGSIGLNSSTTVGAVSPVYVVAQAQSKAAARWVEQALRTVNVKDQIVAYSTGSVRQVLRYHDFAAIRLRLPSNQALSAFEDRTLALYDLVDVATQEANSLSILRDALIPELLSGRMRVKDAESMMENV